MEKFYKNNPPWNYNVVDMESRFEFEIDDPKTGEKHTLSGIMDRIDKNADGSFEIIDYKTKRKMPGQKRNRRRFADVHLPTRLDEKVATHRQ